MKDEVKAYTASTDQPGNATAADHDSMTITQVNDLFPVQLYSEVEPPSCTNPVSR